MSERLIKIRKQKQELNNLKEALLLIKFWTIPDPEILKKQNEKGKVLTLYKKRKTT